MNYNEIAKQVLANIGGKENVSNAAHCVTRLRVILDDQTKYNKEALEEIQGLKVFSSIVANFRSFLEAV